jgi:hypothetical protein
MHRWAAVGLTLAAGALVATAAGSTGFWRSSASPQATLLAGSKPLTTGFLLDAGVSPADQVTIAKRIASVGSRVERIHALWGQIAPSARPKKFNPRNPGDPSYSWSALDTEIKNAVAAGLQPLVTVTGAPPWTQRQGVNANPYGANDPTPSDYGDFATAIARRYSGTYKGLPRVRYWEAWNEPNVSFYLSPQTEGGANDTRVDIAAGLYRGLLNAFADAVHAVNPANIVAGGSLGPFTIRGVSYVETTGGVRFERELLCMSVTGPPKPTCNTPVHLDALSFHPYTSGGPTHKAYAAGDLSLGNMPEARAVLAAAIKAGHVVSRHPVQLWVTEFSWDTDPPDVHAVPMKLHERWVAEALYRMWQNGVSLLIWYQVRDDQYPGSDYQSGLWFRGKTLAQDTPKPSLLAFRFPFVAYPSDGHVSVWGRDESQTAGVVKIESDDGGNWHVVARVKADQYGIFRTTFVHQGAAGALRAVLDGATSVPFALTPPKNENMLVTPFGVGSVK